uniref:RNA polymerase I and III subunit D n=1 Tax=Gallus gallus TaxID=9031 RepID=A0A1L1RZU1_CHICK
APAGLRWPEILTFLRCVVSSLGFHCCFSLSPHHSPDVEFCGYCITHPSESKINFRIQTRGSLPAVEPFRKGLNDLMGVCQHVLDTFEKSMRKYRAQREEEMQ